MAQLASISLPPGPWEAALVLGAYPFLMVTSTYLVRAAFAYIRDGEDGDLDRRRRSVGWVIGKAENVLLLTLVLLGAYTALAVVFAAKGIVSRDGDENYTHHILTGTIVNFTYSVVVGVALRFALFLV